MLSFNENCVYFKKKIVNYHPKNQNIQQENGN